MKNAKPYFRYLLAASSGALATSIGMYCAYDQWHPMVWSAGIVSVCMIFYNFMSFVDA